MGALKTWIHSTVVRLYSRYDEIEAKAKNIIETTEKEDPDFESSDFSGLDPLYAQLDEILAELDSIENKENQRWEIEKEEIGKKKGWKRQLQLHENKLEIIRRFSDIIKHTDFVVLFTQKQA